MKENLKILENKSINVDDFYTNFKNNLEQFHSFPSDYVFKFIMPMEESKIAQLHSIFANSEATISSRESKNGKYICMTIITRVNDTNDVVIYYRQVSEIDGVLML